jgi:predicted ribonuclease YlaK
MELVMCDKRGCVEARKLVISTQTYYTSEFAKMEKKFAAELELQKAENQKCQNCEKKEVKFSESTNERYRKTQESEEFLNVSAENEKLKKELESNRLLDLKLQQEIENIKLKPNSRKEIGALRALLESNKEQYSRNWPRRPV